MTSEFERSILRAMNTGRGNFSAAWLAGKMWPAARGRTFGSRSGRWQRMGAIMERLHQRGLVRRNITEHNQKLWTISIRGQDEIDRE